MADTEEHHTAVTSTASHMQTAVLTSAMGTGRCRPLALIEDLEAYQRVGSDGES